MTTVPSDGVIRPARPDDGRAMAEVHVAAWRATYVGIMPDEFLAGLDVDRLTQRWTQRVAENADDDTRHLVVEVAGRVVGISTVGAPRDEMPDGVAELAQINLHPDSWGNGYGTALHDVQLQELADMGYDSAYLWVADGNERARTFYRARGWTEDGVVKMDDSWDPPIRELRYVRPVP
jgi:GNAT superfamily N-acetyltransferase